MLCTGTMTVRLILAALLLVAVAGASSAANDIVYAARYYNAPGTPGKSAFHIYTISPDGTHRKQITNVSEGDYPEPHWSPNGKLILFKRGSASGDWLWVMDASGSNQRKIVNLKDYPSVTWDASSTRILVTDDPEGDATSMTQTTYDLTGRKLSTRTVRDDRILIPSPDGKLRYDTEAGQIVNAMTGKVVGSVVCDAAVCAWATASTLAVLKSGENVPTTLSIYGSNGALLQRTTLMSSDASSTPVAGADGIWDGLSVINGSQGKYLALQNWHNSTTGTYYGLYVVDTTKSSLTFLAETQFLAWSPDHRRMCTSPGRDMVNYERKADGTWRTVWVAPLNVVDVPSGKLRQLQGGLIWVTGADWRHQTTK